MQIPDGPNGFPTVSATQLRTYGAGGFRLAEQEDAKGCPRLYKAKYVEKRVGDDRGWNLRYGAMVHHALYLMEEEAIGPEEALDRAFPADMTPEDYKEALADLTQYLERGSSPTDRFGTVAVEVELDALLYEDEDYGPIYYRGILDWLGIDVEDPSVLHFVDYKTNRTPPAVSDVLGDVQLKGYHYLIAANWSRFMQTDHPRIVTHLDAIKWREVSARFDEVDMDAWHAWVVAVVRRILRDDEANPRLNPGCAWCPVKADCPKWEELPQTAEEIRAGRPKGADVDTTLRWRDRANAVRLLLEKAVKEIDLDMQDQTRALGGMTTKEYEFTLEPDWQEQQDVRALHRVLGSDVFYRIVTISKKALKAATADAEPSMLAQVQQALRREPVGTKVVKKKRNGGS